MTFMTERMMTMKTRILRKIAVLCLVLALSGSVWAGCGKSSCGEKKSCDKEQKQCDGEKKSDCDKGETKEGCSKSESKSCEKSS